MRFKTRLALIDIRDAIASAESFLGDMSLEDFMTSQLHVFAATRALEIISEASRRLSAEFRDRHPGLPWKKIMGAGNIYRHDYQNIEETMIWSAIRNDLPPLRAAVEQALREGL